MLLSKVLLPASITLLLYQVFIRCATDRETAPSDCIRSRMACKAILGTYSISPIRVRTNLLQAWA